MFTHKLRGDW